VRPLRAGSRLSAERSYRAYLCGRMKLTGRGAGFGEMLVLRIESTDTES